MEVAKTNASHVNKTFTQVSHNNDFSNRKPISNKKISEIAFDILFIWGCMAGTSAFLRGICTPPIKPERCFSPLDDIYCWTVWSADIPLCKLGNMIHSVGSLGVACILYILIDNRAQQHKMIQDHSRPTQKILNKDNTIK